MTRENKLALVVGFALILFVGILISDHFSIARHQPTADLSVARDAAAQRGAESSPQYIAMIAPPVQQIPAVDTAHVPTEAGRTANGQLVRDLAEPISQEQDIQAQQQASETQQHEVLMLGMTSNGQQVAVPIDSQRIQAQAPEEIDTPSMRTVNARTQDADVPAGFEKVQEGTTQLFKFHDVLPGESLYAIVKNEMGDTTKVAEIAKLNKLDDPSMLQVGQRIRIPAPPAPPSTGTSSVKTVTTQKVVPVTGGQQDAANAKTNAKRLAPPEATATAVATYTVQKGDNLSTIATKVLGSKTRWQELYNLNKDVIKSPDNLKVGTKLTLPERRG